MGQDEWTERARASRMGGPPKVRLSALPPVVLALEAVATERLPLYFRDAQYMLFVVPVAEICDATPDRTSLAV